MSVGPRARRWRLWTRRVVLTLLGLCCVGNAVVFAHAWRFTHFVPSGTRTPSPEALSLVDRVLVLATGVRVPRPVIDRRPVDVGLAASSVRIGGAGAWVIEGSGPGCVALFHGYSGVKSDLLDEAAAIHAMGPRVVLVDFPGSGESPGDSTSLGWAEADTVRDVAAYCDAEEPVVLFGKSMGAVAALRAVGVLGVSPDAMILESPFDRLDTTVGHRFRSMGVPAFPGAELLVFWGGVQLGFDGFAHNPVEYAADVVTPTLVLHGSEDPRVAVEDVRSVHDALGGVARLEIFPGAGHEALISSNREAWIRTTAGWLGDAGLAPPPVIPAARVVPRMGLP